MSRQTINRNGAIAANDRNLGSNQTEVFNYQVGMTRTFRHKGWIVSDSRVSFSQTINDPLGNNSGAVGTPSNTATHLTSQVLSSGSRFTRFIWSINTAYEENMIEDGDEVTDLVANVKAEYAVNRFFSALATAGYQKLDAGNNSDSSNGLTWTAGGQFTPGPRTLLRIEYGNKFDGSYYEGDFSYKISQATVVVGSYRQDVSIQQTAVNNAFANLTVNETGDFIDDTTGLPFAQSAAGDDLSEINNVNRTRTFNLSLSGSRGRNTYGGSISWNGTETRLQSRKQKTQSVNVNYGRQLSPTTDISVDAAVTDTNDNAAANSTTINLSASVDYRIGTSVTGSARLSHLRRNSRDPAAELVENSLSARLQFTF